MKTEGCCASWPQMPPKARNTAWATTRAGGSFPVGETEFIALSVLLCRRYSRIHDNFHGSILLYHSNSHSRRVDVSHVRRNIPAMVFGQATKGSLCCSLGKPCLAGDLAPGAACFAEGCNPGCVGVSLAITLANRRINNLQQDFQSLTLHVDNSPSDQQSEIYGRKPCYRQ